MFEYSIEIPVYVDYNSDKHEMLTIHDLKELQEYLIKYPGSIFYFDKTKFLIEKDFLNCEDNE